MSQILPPFRLLTLGRANPIDHPSAELNAHVASFRLPDGRKEEGLPAPSKPDAVLNLFAADAVRPLALPYATHFLPLCNATLRLCDAFSWLLYHEFRFEDLLMDHAAQGHPLPEEETLRALREVLDAVRSTVEEANRVSVRLRDIYADPRAGTTQNHPLAFYAEYVLAPGALLYCQGVMESLGVQGAIGEADLDFTVHGTLLDPRWPTAQASLLTEQRQGLLRHYLKRLVKLKAKAPTEEERAKWIVAMMDKICESSRTLSVPLASS
jgi:hypothetical protein